MLTFVDLTDLYWMNSVDKIPVCAFLSRYSDKFIELANQNLFTCLEDVQQHPRRHQMADVLPEGFFE